MKKGIIVLCVLALIGASTGYYMYNKPVESILSMKVDLEVGASELLRAFENDETSANSSYLDKVVVVEGKVQKVEQKEGITTVYLGTDNPMSNVIFQLESPNLKIKEGGELTLKGVCTGYLMDVVLVRAVVV